MTQIPKISKIYTVAFLRLTLFKQTPNFCETPITETSYRRYVFILTRPVSPLTMKVPLQKFFFLFFLFFFIFFIIIINRYYDCKEERIQKEEERR